MHLQIIQVNRQLNFQLNKTRINQNDKRAGPRGIYICKDT